MPLSVPGGYPTWVYAIVVLAAVLFLVTMAAAALGWYARRTRSTENSGSIVDAYRVTITLMDRVPPTADGTARHLADSPPQEDPRAGEDDIDIQILYAKPTIDKPARRPESIKGTRHDRQNGTAPSSCPVLADALPRCPVALPPIAALSTAAKATW